MRLSLYKIENVKGYTFNVKYKLILHVCRGEKYIMKKVLIAGAGVAALGLAAMPVLGAFADVTDTVEITIASSCSVNSDTEDTPGTGQKFTATMVNGDTKEWEADGTGGELYVTCNDAGGWNVTAQGFSNDTAGTTTMVPTASGTAIPTGTTLDGTVSDWAFKVADGNTGATIVSAYSSYAQVPATATRVAYKSGTAVSEGLIYTGYKVGVSPTQQADKYTGKVKYVVSAGVGS